MSLRNSDIAGRLRHPTTLQQVARTPDSMGGFTEVWSTFASPWAEIIPVSAKTVLWSEAQQHRVTHVLTIRYLSGVTSDMRFLYGTRVLQIRSYRDVEELNEFLEIAAEEGAAS